MRKIQLENIGEPSVKKFQWRTSPEGDVRDPRDFSEASHIFSEFYRRAAVFCATFLLPKKLQNC
jgi:hypothetical protein